jgi:hypothetical protein
LTLSAFPATVPNEPDACFGAGDNLLLLLDLPIDCRVLILGAQLKRWRSVFRNCYYQERFTAQQLEAQNVDLILYHAACATTKARLLAQLRALKRLAEPSGRLLIFAPNFYSFTRLKMIRARGWKGLGGWLRCGRWGYRRVLADTGFVEYREFLPFPGVEDTEELVAPRSRFLELPHYWHPLFHLARRIGLFPAIADGYVFIAGPAVLEQGQLLKAVTNLLSATGNQTTASCTLERFDLRLHGALVLFVAEQYSGCKVIVRVVSDQRSRDIVCRNQEFLRGLQTNVDLPVTVKALLPQPLGDFRLTASSIYVETLLEGILAWKVNRGHLRKRIHAEAAEFIFRLQHGTRCKVRLGTTELDELFAADLARLASCPGVTPLLRESVVGVVSKIRQALQGREMYLTASHGDYGYGNILVDARTGGVKGVIDWDTGRSRDLPGLDFLNLEIQRTRAETDSGLLTAFETVFSLALARSSLDANGNYQTYFGVSADLLPAFLHLALFRYLTRASQYPEVFAAEQAEYLCAFEFLSSKAPL